ncbi:MAG: hypothetical protein FWH37_09670 [Candidatus Bathyarchaeota archaeon]|nr:hypothetical protein [Candidatus Termiticorpusculum sp.]
MNYLEYGAMSCSTIHDADMFYVNNIIIRNTFLIVTNLFLYADGLAQNIKNKFLTNLPYATSDVTTITQ